MNNRLKNIITSALLGIALVLLSVAQASAQIVVEQCDTMEFSVVSRASIPETHYVWAMYNSSTDPVDVLDPATSLDPALFFVDGQYAGSTVQVLGLQAGTYYLRIQVWDEVTCTDNVEMYVIEIIESQLSVDLYADSVCVDEQPPYVRVVFTGKGPYNIEYSTDDGLTTVNMNGITEDEITIPITDPLPVGETTFWVMSLEDNCRAIEYTLEEDRPSTGIIIYPLPDKQPIYLKDGD